eukprot:TRINITY_DN4351_c0_g1_i2.p1 TRINITY_DN4351_c0_g1~~TRINITY_DN4351_c0_g1_i2.p1  ORF type:complete len:202 (+),score=31.08 TRINITY_DN4351_c0_g1_i2:37-606(+)
MRTLFVGACKKAWARSHWTTPHSIWYSNGREAVIANTEVPKDWKVVSIEGHVEYRMPENWHLETDSGGQGAYVCHSITPEVVNPLKENGLMVVLSGNTEPSKDLKVRTKEVMALTMAGDRTFEELDVEPRGQYAVIRSVAENIETEGLLRVMVTPSRIAAAWTLSHVDIPHNDMQRRVTATIVNSIRWL